MSAEIDSDSLEGTGVRPVQRALISVSDKSGVLKLARFLSDRGVEIFSSGGSARFIREQGVAVADVSKYTGYPEIMQGRIKTLHPKVHGGLLGREPEDQQVMRELGIDAIDLLVVNFYPFGAAVRKASGERRLCIENIDIGGPAMVRSAAKNHDRVAVVVTPEDYPRIESEIRTYGGISFALRETLAARAFCATAAYDAEIVSWLQNQDADTDLPETLTIAMHKALALRYGENPHQRAAFYRHETGSGLPGLRQLQGKTLSFNNISDADTAHRCVHTFNRPACVIVKHAVPCGAACGHSAAEAYRRAFSADPDSAFGGVVALNQPLDAATAAAITETQFAEVLIAPQVSDDALTTLAGKPSLRVLQGRPTVAGPDCRSCAGGWLVQEHDEVKADQARLTVKTRRAPDDDETADLLFAWRIVSSVKSNAIVLACGQCTAGIGSGQTSRVAAVRLAAERAQARFRGKRLVMASEAFFPFPDSLELARKAGVSAVIQPGGSRNDEEIIETADRYDVAMVFTGMRHFRH